VRRNFFWGARLDFIPQFIQLKFSFASLFLGGYAFSAIVIEIHGRGGILLSESL